MTLRVPHPKVEFTDHAQARLGERTDLTVAEAKREIRAALQAGRVVYEGRNTFLVECGPREYPVARSFGGRFHVLTVLAVAAALAA